MDDTHEIDEANRRRRRNKIILLVVAAVAVAVEQYNKLFLRKRPYRGETVRGANETERIIGVSDTTSRAQIRMSRRAFYSLLHMLTERGLLQNSRSVQVEEQLVCFLHTIGHNAKNRVVLHTLGHSGETISRYFNIVLGAIIKLYPVLMRPPSTTTHRRIAAKHGKFFPYFKDCIGAIDGSHCPARVPVDQHRRFRDRKGDISQNILAACDFDMKFTYILSGWEGSAADSRILDDALHREGEGKIAVPNGKYYLVDAGFANKEGFLRPYRNVRYHLKEWRNSELSPVNKYELFNLRHSQLRNVIERSFGLLKARFKILKSPPEYPFKTQAWIVIACVLIHNHILTQNRVEEEEEWIRLEEIQEQSVGGQATRQATNVVPEDSESDEEEHEHVDWEQFREDMAQKMWDDWINGVDESEEEDEDENEDEDDDDEDAEMDHSV